jgi:thiamine biosynthesis lipoprotein
MKIGFGAIGKGYAANRAKKLMQSMGIENGVVNASGDLISWGNQADGREWSIAISDPKDKHKTIGWLNVSNQAVVTSGNYEKFVEFDCVRYSHIINPRTGMPATGTKSVTIICPDAEIADALATSVFILGENDGIELINKLNGIECFLITDKDELKNSQNLKLNYY